MPNYQRKVVYLSDEQFHQLVNNGSITVNGVTVTYSENDLYVTPQSESLVDTDAIANAYDPTATYAVGDHVIHDGYYYVCNTAIGTAEAWTPAHWTQTTIGAEVKNFKDNVVAVRDTQPTSGENVIWLMDTAPSSVQVPTYDEFVGVVAEPYSSSATYAVGDHVIYNGGYYKCKTAISTAESWNSAHWDRLTFAQENESIMSALNDKYEKPSGGIPASDLASGVIPSVPVQDVQVNGTSVLSNGVANVPYAGADAGVVKIPSNNAYGLGMLSDGTVAIAMGSFNDIKNGSGYYKPIVPTSQHQAAFYGLAKAAGDSTQSSSSNAVGVYTETAKQKIHAMLSPQYRLIKEITITGSDTGVVLVETDTNGDPFSLFDVIIDFNMTAASATSNGAIYPNISNDPGYDGENMPFLTVPNLFNTSASRRSARLHVDGGRFTGDTELSAFTNHYASVFVQTNRNASGMYACDPITKLRIWSLNAHKFGDGSVIKIYGR